ncbi:cation:proton antiporter [Rhizobium rhizogenes]|uniref:Cation:proton antiporter n=1 Tax=Rhizobium rhizogenes TaxID=359 RepID=A0AA92H7W4_RHIRH|nr:cation:proton antiporter [Rhizobium rhizogenes]PVE51153.1 cation:proton antiporter [Rhizobium rhizogenes]PVE64034.1 cation:proton antiporter [Agrobacterium tumefaciens]PVE73297.1 cation:proton antiporter [Sphingomonas sp. TPD3009]
MTPELLVSYASFAALLILCVAFLLTVYRVTVGPTLPDRVVALDMLVGIAIGFIAVIAIRTGFNLYVDIAVALCLVGFLATVAFARFILSRQPENGLRKRQILDGTDVLAAPPALQNVTGEVRKRSAKGRRKRAKGKTK